MRNYNETYVPMDMLNYVRSIPHYFKTFVRSDGTEVDCLFIQNAMGEYIVQLYESDGYGQQVANNLNEEDVKIFITKLRELGMTESTYEL